MIRFKCAGTGSNGNCYSMTDMQTGKILLLDAGLPLPTIKKLVNWQVANISACFISHEHKDHVKSADKLRKMGMTMFEPYKGGRQRFSKDGWALSAFPLEHDGTENRGCYIICPDGHKMLYLTDFSYSKFVFKSLKVNTILIECNHMDEISEDDNQGKYVHVLRGHSSLSTVCDFLKVNQTDALKTVILCHLSEDNANPEEMVRKVKDVVGENVTVFIADKGVEVEL